MIIKRFFKSCRYDLRLLITSIVFLIAVVALTIGINMYAFQARQISQLTERIWNFHANQVRIKVQSVKIMTPALKLDGVFQDHGILYAVFNGRLFKAGDLVANKYEIQEISRYKVSVKDTASGATDYFTLINPTLQMKGQKI